MQFCLDRQIEILNAAGAKKVWSFPVEDVTYSRHLMGTCRMGNDPRTSVVDRWNRSHDVRNLFIVDGSSLVTCGRQQPTETIQAVAYRAADHMASPRGKAKSSYCTGGSSTTRHVIFSPRGIGPCRASHSKMPCPFCTSRTSTSTRPLLLFANVGSIRLA